MTFAIDNLCLLVESTILFALLSHLIAHHCKLGEMFLLKTLKHRKIPKVESNLRDFSSILYDFQPIFIGTSIY